MTSKSNDYCFGIIVVSDRIAEGLDIDVSSEVASNALSERGFKTCSRVIVRNSYREIIKAIRESSNRLILLLGGTGPSPRDITVDVIEDIAWRCLPGFGELFRHLSYEKIGFRAILTRTSLCILHDGKIVTVLPGSPEAVSLGIEILSRVIDHIVEEVDRFEGPHRHPIE